MSNREIARILLIESLDMDYADYMETFKDCLDEMEGTLALIKETNLYSVLEMICEAESDILTDGFGKYIMQEIGEQ